MTTKEREALVVYSQKLVGGLVQRAMNRYGLPEDWREELSAAGNLGLVQAATRFDPNRGVTFRSFASQRVWGEVVESLRRGQAEEEVLQESLDAERSHSPNPEERAITAQAAVRVHEAMMSLDVRERELIETLYPQGPSLSAVAEEQGISTGWASRLRERAVKRLRDLPGLERADDPARAAKREVLHDALHDVGKERTSQSRSRSRGR